MEKRNLLVMMGFYEAMIFFSATSQPFLGVNYGGVADNLPPPSATAGLLQSTTFSRLRLYGTDVPLLSAFSPTLSLLVGAANSDLASLASSPSAASSWASSHLLPFLPSISAISVGNEVIYSGDASLISSLLPAMENLAAALNSSVKVSTVHSMAALAASDPPSAGAFRSDLAYALDPVLAFLNQTGSPFMVNPYPYFAYLSDPRPETLAFCLFEPNPGRPDSGSGLTYANMFDAQVDAVRAALDAKGYAGVDVVVAETGWPHAGDPDEVGATAENARAYNGNLVAHLRSNKGTPRMPGRTVETYLFALYDEDLKSGPTSERSFGLFAANMTPNYDAGILKAESPSASPAQVPNPGPVQGLTPGPAPALVPDSGRPQVTVAAPTQSKGKAAQPSTAEGFLPSVAGSRQGGEYGAAAAAAATGMVLGLVCLWV